MFRKSLAVLLVLGWLILSGFDVVEDLDLPDEVAFSNPAAAEVPGAPWSCRLVNNIVESANTSSDRNPVIVDDRFAGCTAVTPVPASHTKLKLHKLHAIFLI